MVEFAHVDMTWNLDGDGAITEGDGSVKNATGDIEMSIRGGNRFCQSCKYLWIRKNQEPCFRCIYNPMLPDKWEAKE